MHPLVKSNLLVRLYEIRIELNSLKVSVVLSAMFHRLLGEYQ